MTPACAFFAFTRGLSAVARARTSPAPDGRSSQRWLTVVQEGVTSHPHETTYAKVPSGGPGALVGGMTST